MSKLNHIAFIMDGNRRWAKSRNLPLIAGHHKGAGRIEPLVAYATKRGIRYVTFWAFSVENWQRGEKEVGFIMRVFRDYLNSSIFKKMMEKGVRVKVIGDFEAFPEDIVAGLRDIVEKSKDNTGIVAIFAINYGGRAEILRAVNAIVREERKSLREIATSSRELGTPRNDKVIDDEMFSSFLYTKGLPEPDLIVRTGGEQRLSGFLPWQSLYSELYFTQVLWPDFDEEGFEMAIEEFEGRTRKFGK
jgi:undecaprenyl diphosphate synthase